MPNGTYGGVRGRKTKVGRKLLRFPPTRLYASGHDGHDHLESHYKFSSFFALEAWVTSSVHRQH